MSFCILNYGCHWRPEEYTSLRKYFGEEKKYPNGDFLFPRLNTEWILRPEYETCLNLERNFKGTIINSTESFVYTDAKETCLDVWKQNGINVPNYFVFDTNADFENKRHCLGMNFPMIIRLNDNTGARDTFLVDNEDELKKALEEVEKAYQARSKLRKMFTKKMCSQYIDISIEQGWYSAYRVVVSGGKIVVCHPKMGPSRLAQGYEKFTTDIRDLYVKQALKAIELKNKYNQVFVDSLKVLNLQYQAVDFIVDKQDSIYLLEVQPFYNCGNPEKSYPPWWPFSPSLPENLVNWLVSSKDSLYPQLSDLYDGWIDRKQHFERVYGFLSQYFENKGD